LKISYGLLLIFCILSWLWIIPWLFLAPLTEYVRVFEVDQNRFSFQNFNFVQEEHNCKISQILDEVRVSDPYRNFIFKSQDNSEVVKICLGTYTSFPKGPVDVKLLTEKIVKGKEDKIIIKNQISVPAISGIPFIPNYETRDYVILRDDVLHTFQTIGYWKDSTSPIFIVVHHTSSKPPDVNNEIKLIESVEPIGKTRYGFPNTHFYGWMLSGAGVFLFVFHYFRYHRPRHQITDNTKIAFGEKILRYAFGLAAVPLTDIVFSFLPFVEFIPYVSPFFASPTIPWDFFVFSPLLASSYYLLGKDE